MIAPAGKATHAVAQRLNGALRRGILAAARSRRMDAAARKHGMRLGAQRFVAGETFAECAEVLARLNASGLHANTTLLGEDVLAADEARRSSRSTSRSSTASPSAACASTSRSSSRTSDSCSTRSSPTTTSRSSSTTRPRSATSSASTWSTRASSTRPLASTAACAPTAATRGHGAAGLPLPHARRPDGAAAAAAQPAPRQGRLPRAADVAYPRKADVDSAYARLIEATLAGGAYTAIATHDEAMIEQTIALCERMGVARDRFEFQMLYGVRPRLQLHWRSEDSRCSWRPRSARSGTRT